MREIEPGTYERERERAQVNSAHCFRGEPHIYCSKIVDLFSRAADDRDHTGARTRDMDSARRGVTLSPPRVGAIAKFVQPEWGLGGYIRTRISCSNS